MPLEQPVNGVATTLAASITSTTQATISLTSATGFTNAQYHIIVSDGTNSEIMLATALSGTTLSVTRTTEAIGGSSTAHTFTSPGTTTVTVCITVQTVLNMILQATIPGTQVPNVVVLVAQAAAPVFDTDMGNIFSITSIAQNITSMTTGMTGTMAHGQVICFEFIDNGTARTIAWGAGFVSTPGGTLPTGTVANTIKRVWFTSNMINTTWDCIGVA